MKSVRYCVKGTLVVRSTVAEYKISIVDDYFKALYISYRAFASLRERALKSHCVIL